MAVAIQLNTDDMRKAGGPLSLVLAELALAATEDPSAKPAEGSAPLDR